MGPGIHIALYVSMFLSATGNVALGAFRSHSKPADPGARHAMRIVNAVWAEFLPVVGVPLLGLSAAALAAGQPDAWQGVSVSGVPLACWPVAILALRKRRADDRNL